MTKLETILSVHAELPSRHSVDILTGSIEAGRPSRSRNDSAPIGGIATHLKGRGIIRESRKECWDERWMIISTITTPETDAERDAIAKLLAREWDDAMSAVAMGAPDDDRDRDNHESKRDQYRRLRALLVDAGLLS